MKKLFLGLFLVLITSCSLGTIEDLRELVTNCLCTVNVNLETLANKEKGSIKEFSFINSKLFDLGISKEDFALSSAILINNYYEIDSGQIIKVNIVKDSGDMNKDTTTYTYEQSVIEEQSPKYFEIETIINDFVKNIYQGNFYKCKMLTDIPVATEEFNLEMTKIFGSLEKGYINTKIFSYKVEEKVYHIYSGIFTENDMIKLYTMAFKETENGLKIIAFEFY